jgi:hypothetical protein
VVDEAGASLLATNLFDSYPAALFYPIASILCVVQARAIPVLRDPASRVSANQRAYVGRLRDSELLTAQFGQIRNCTAACEIDLEIISGKIWRSLPGEEGERLGAGPPFTLGKLVLCKPFTAYNPRFHFLAIRRPQNQLVTIYTYWDCIPDNQFRRLEVSCLRVLGAVAHAA